MSLDGQSLQRGRYHLHKVIKHGNRSEVYLATDTDTKEEVAIKILHSKPELYPLDEKEIASRIRLFRKMQRAIYKFGLHPHILPVYECQGEVLPDDNLIYYMVMPYCIGGSFADWLSSRGNANLLSLKEVLDLMQQIAEALQHIHSLQGMHLDIKPSNLLIAPGTSMSNGSFPHIALADIDITQFMATPTIFIRNESNYLAPEQWNSRAVPASDQYALAIIAYELLTNHQPFSGDRSQELMFNQMNTPPPPPSQINSLIPTAVDKVILRALSPEPQYRYDSVMHFAQAFQRAVQYKDLSSTLFLSLLEAKNGGHKIVNFPELNIQAEVVLTQDVQDGEPLFLYYDENGVYSDDTGESPRGKLTIIVKIRRNTSILTPRPTRVLSPLDATGSIPHPDPVSAKPTKLPVPDEFTPFLDPQQRPSRKWIIAASVLASILLIALGVIIILVVSLKSTELSASKIRATAVVQAAATEASIATATAQANFNATATAQADLNATATAMAVSSPPDTNNTGDQIDPICNGILLILGIIGFIGLLSSTKKK